MVSYHNTEIWRCDLLNFEICRQIGESLQIFKFLLNPNFSNWSKFLNVALLFMSMIAPIKMVTANDLIAVNLATGTLPTAVIQKGSVVQEKKRARHSHYFKRVLVDPLGCAESPLHGRSYFLVKYNSTFS